MGFWSALGSICSSVGSAISSAVSSIGSAVSSFVSTVAPVIGSVVDTLKPVAEALGKFANAFLQGLGILMPGEQIEDMGDRALQAADKGITPEKFEDFDDYIKALREFDLDPENSAKRSKSEKLVAGLAVATMGVESKFNAEPGSLNGLWLLPMANPDYFTPERMQGLISAGRLGGDIYAYLEKRLSGAEARTFEKDLAVDAQGMPLKGNELDTLYNALDGAREKWADINRQIEARD